MPLPVDNLRFGSSEEEIERAISESISICVEEGKSQEQCVGMAYNIARRKTGKELK
jgi:hypothetical protein